MLVRREQETGGGPAVYNGRTFTSSSSSSESSSSLSSSTLAGAFTGFLALTFGVS